MKKPGKEYKLFLNISELEKMLSYLKARNARIIETKVFVNTYCKNRVTHFGNEEDFSCLCRITETEDK